MAMKRGTAAVAALLVVVGAVGALGWWYRGDLWRLWQGEPAAPTEVSQEAADLAEGKLARLRSEGEEVSLSSVELSSLLRFRAPVWASNTVGDPAVALSGDTVVVSGVVPTDRLPSHPELDRVRGLLPDSSRFEIVGHVRPLDDGRAALEVAEVEFAGLPIPARYYPDVLRRIGRRDEPGLSPTALAVRLPEGVGSARVAGGLLILTP